MVEATATMDERVLAAAAARYGDGGEVSYRALRQDVGVSESSLSSAVARLKKLGKWPYTTRRDVCDLSNVKAYTDDELAARIDAAKRARAAKADRLGISIHEARLTMIEIDEACDKAVAELRSSKHLQPRLRAVLDAAKRLYGDSGTFDYDAIVAESGVGRGSIHARVSELRGLGLWPYVRASKGTARPHRRKDRSAEAAATHAVETVAAAAAVERARTTFATGAVRSADAAAVRYDLVSTEGLKRLAGAYAEGAAKYPPHNWRRGIPFSDLLNHLQRHIELFKAGDTSEDHLAHAAWGLFTLMDFEATLPTMDDRYVAMKGGDS